MANEEQLRILNKGVDVWNKWKVKNPGVEVDLSKGTFTLGDLTGADFTGANLSATNFTLATLRQVNFNRANLEGAKLRGAHLSGTDLREARLNSADLRGSDLIGSNFIKAQVGYTSFGNSDLSQTIGLESVVHSAPSSISIDTFAHSKGKIPEAFLKGCGLSDWEIELVKLYNPNLGNDEFINIQNNVFDLRQRQTLQISPLFVSYSHADSEFVDKIESQLNAKGIRFWRDIHDMKAGRMEKQIDRAIRQNPTVLLILSKNSQQSDWVEHEVRTARDLEKDLGRDVLCPVALDDSWKASPWPKRVMEQIMEYNILDFSAWEDDVKFEGMFRKLIDGLELFYKG